MLSTTRKFRIGKCPRRSRNLFGLFALISLLCCVNGFNLTTTTTTAEVTDTPSSSVNLNSESSNSVSVNDRDNNNGVGEISNSLQTFPVIPILDTDTERDLTFRAMLCVEIPRSLLPFYRFHLTTRKCYLTGSRGPCGSNMIFVKESFTRAIGKCICDPVIGQHRPLVQHRESNQCYFLFTQGYCENSEWLVPISGENINRDSNSYWAICRENICRPVAVKINVTSNLTPLALPAQNSSANITDPATETPILSQENQNATDGANTNTTTTPSAQNSTTIPYSVTTVSGSNSTEQPTIPDPDLDSAPVIVVLAPEPPSNPDDYVLFNGNCVQLGAIHEFCPENTTLSFRDGLLSCNRESEVFGDRAESESSLAGRIPRTTIGIPSIPNRHQPSPGENEIVSESRRRRRKRSIFTMLFPSWNFMDCPQGSTLNVVLRVCQKSRAFPYAFLWGRRDRRKDSQESEESQEVKWN